MKKFPQLLFTMVCLATVFGCEKAVVLPIGSNAILPLAVNNSWTYVDTVIATTSLPSVDTVVTEITFRIAATTYIDMLETTDGKRSLKRIPGYEVQNDMPNSYFFSIFPIGDTVWMDSWISFPTYGYMDCPGLQVVLDTMPELKLAHTGSLMPALVYPTAVGSTVPVAPAFLARARCENEFGTLGQNPFRYQVNFHPIKYEAGQITVTTPAGTFPCLDFGSTLWREGVGMVQSEQDGALAFVSEDGVTVSGSVHWKRSLKAYHLE